MIHTLAQKFHPGLRGAFFYAAFWGAIGAYEPFIAVYFLQCGLDETQIGWMAAVLPFCTLLISPLVSRLADRTGRRVRLLALACAGYGLALTLPSLPGLEPGFPLLLALVGLFAAFRSPIIPLSDSLIAPMAVRYQLDFGSMRLWGSVFFTITAIGLGGLWQRAGFETMFLAAGLGFILVVLAALLLEEPRPGQAAPRSATRARLVLDPGFVFLVAATFLIIAGLFMAGTFGAVYVTGLGGSPALVGALMGVAALGEVPGMMFGLRIARRLGDTNTLLIAYVLRAVGLPGYTVSTLPGVLLAFALLRGVGFGAILVCTVTIINHRAPPNLASTYQGLLSSLCWGLAPLLGGPFSGWVYQTYGPLVLFLTAAGLTVTAGLLLTPTYRLWRSTPQD